MQFKTRITCTFGVSTDCFQTEEFFTRGNPLNFVQTVKNMYSDYLFCIILVPDLDIAFVKCPKFTKVSTFVKYRGIKFLIPDFPFLQGVLKK